MPGILPMKVIKLGSNAQSRVAQACDRCRSKKIRCDGVTPCCSQCANVGFECKTSDKLSRRAFPRGYTESLEERVRTLEGEVRELKDLLDSKDEKIDMLSRIQSHSPSHRRPSSIFSNTTSATSCTSSAEPPSTKDEASMSQVLPAIEDENLTISSSASASSGKSFIDNYKTKLKESSSQAPNFKAQTFFDYPSGKSSGAPQKLSKVSPIPSRMASDQMINLFLQEWSPLFPILHRPTVLNLYNTFLSEPESIKSPQDQAQIYLVFGIAAISNEWTTHQAESFEPKWRCAIEGSAKDISVSSLQCLLLAELYCIAKGDHERLRKYRNAAAKLSRRLGLHQSQKRSSIGPLLTETRKRLFWVLFVLDCFSAAILGQPRALRDIEIACEDPQDVDDEYITEDAFLTAVPGESTRLSSALALIRGARVMADVLDTVYPTNPSHQVLFQDVASLSERLQSWFGNLPPHLRLHFTQDKPSTNVIGSRSPFLSLVYHYICTLLHRPLISANNESQASSSLCMLAQCSKHIIQIVQLLEERRMSFSFCLNKYHVLTLAGFGLLFQALDLSRDTKTFQDHRRYLDVVAATLERAKAPGSADFRNIVTVVFKTAHASHAIRSDSDQPGSEQMAIRSVPATRGAQAKPRPKSQSARKRLSAERSLANSQSKVESEGNRRSTGSAVVMPAFEGQPPYNLVDIDSASGNPFMASHRSQGFPIAPNGREAGPLSLPNLDYLDFGSEGSTKNDIEKDAEQSQLASPDGPVHNVADSNAPSSDMFAYISDAPSDSKAFEWCTDLWDLPGQTDWEPSQGGLSLSEEDLTSGEELSSCGASGHLPMTALPHENGLATIDGFSGSFGL